MMKKTDIETLRNADWDGVEREVVTKIRMLKAACEHLDPNDLNDKIAEDLFLPALRLLGEFCTRIVIDETANDSDQARVSPSPESAGWAILVNPDFINGRGQWARANHRGYTMDWREAGRYSRREAEHVAAGSHGKYTAVPLPIIPEPNAENQALTRERQ